MTRKKKFKIGTEILKSVKLFGPDVFFSDAPKFLISFVYRLEPERIQFCVCVGSPQPYASNADADAADVRNHLSSRFALTAIVRGW